MKLLNFTAKNFGSYDEITFSFEQGLVLISGQTGSGKSTFQDIAFWGLFGITAKGGSVDDVRSWTSPNSPTEVKLSVLTSNGIIEVTRVRGRSNENDLFWIGQESDISTPKRGKDLKETQALLEKCLGISAETYQTSAYFHEFSPTVHFFYESKKNQRSLLESIATLDWPIRLATKIKHKQKAIKLKIQALEKTIEKEKGKLEQLNLTYVDVSNRETSWEQEHKLLLISLNEKSDLFENTKQKYLLKITSELQSWEEQTVNKKQKLNQILHSHTQICVKCNQYDEAFLQAERELFILQNQKNPAEAKLKQINESTNNFSQLIENEIAKTTPFKPVLLSIQSDIDKVLNLLMIKVLDLQELQEKQSHLEILLDYTYELRGQLLINSVKAIESNANQYLSDYFDAELRFTLDIEGSDSIILNIYKNGHECNFKQLSKGQRGLLNLCFSVAVMKACQNRSGVYFSQLFFDEALSGFDSELKVKAFRLFQKLNIDHESIYLIDHSTEFKSLFDKQYLVEISSDISTIVVDE